MSDVRVGTVSWSKEDWAGTFYPKGIAADGHLAHYAKTFDTVEVDQTFYRTPTRALCLGWREQTPEHFRFSVKAMKRITHDKVLAGCEAEMGWFLGALEGLGPKFGFAVLQFGKFGKKSKCPDVGAFTKRLGEFAKLCPDPGRFVVEVRNPEWIGDELLGFLRERGFVFALTETEGMPPPAETWEKWGAKLVTGREAYARVVGERKKMEAMVKKFDMPVVDRTEETKTWVRIVKSLAVPAWVYFANYFAGHSPASAELFRRLWNE
jgi:uncharacterized protein YecE (DUF72 family)